MLDTQASAAVMQQSHAAVRNGIKMDSALAAVSSFLLRTSAPSKACQQLVCRALIDP
jgi:hypothetical protein